MPRSRGLCFASLILCVTCLAVSPAVYAQAAPATEKKDAEAAVPKVGKMLDLPAAFGKKVPTSVADLRAIEKHVTDLAKKVLPSTVGVRIGRAQGSGVIISEDGFVLTAAHVIGEPGKNVTLIMPDGKQLKGKSLGLNRGIDAGLIKITDSGDWPAVEIGDMDSITAGDWCVATGHPGGFRPDRPPVLRLGRVLTKRDAVLQTDCTLVGGDSGGPLFDMHGRVIGINSRIGASTNWNFHVPISAYSSGWTRMVASESWGGRGNGAILGVSGDDHPKGCKVTSVGEGMPAEKIGLKVGDIITKFDGKPFKGFDGLAAAVGRHRPGAKVKLEYLRDEETIKVEVTLAKRP